MGIESSSSGQGKSLPGGSATADTAVLSLVAAPAYAVDREGRCTEVNEAALSLMGYSRSECLGHDMHSLIHGTREDGKPYPPEECPVFEARVRGRTVHGFREILWTKQRGCTHVRCSAMPLRLGDAPQGAVVTLTGESDPHITGTLAEGGTEALLQKKETLERLLLKSEKEATLGRLAATIAHEINNPLEAVTNLLYLVRQDKALPAECLEYVTQAEDELRRVTDIVSQTLRFHRSRPHPKECLPEDLVDSVLALHQGTLRTGSIEILRQHRRSRTFTCAEGDIRQILNNLVSNAIDATIQTRGRITIRTAPARDAHTGAEGIRISVSDSGHGMTQETAARIFEPSYTTKGVRGSGLGLWVCRSLAHRHGGRITVRTSTKRHTQGTTFSLFLPQASVAA